MTAIQTPLITDTWVTTTWAEYIEIIEKLDSEKGKYYYYNGQARIEMLPFGPDHADDHGIMIILINLFGMIKNIPMRLLVNCSYRKTGVREAQPDISYYLRKRTQLSPHGSSVVNLALTPPPDLVIEIADTSFLDDLGLKRMLYEELGVSEYWIVNIKKLQIIAFKIIADRGSERISESEIIPGLAIALLEEGLQRSRQMDNTEVGNWFFQKVSN